MGQTLNSLINDLTLHGAEHWHTMFARVGQPRLAELLEQKILRDLDTPVGLVVVLGSRGRTLAGKDSAYRPDPNAAASSVLRRRVRARLETDGWNFTDYIDHRRGLLRLQRRNETLLVSCAYPDLSPQTLEHYVTKYLTVSTNSRFLFTALEPEPYKKILKKHSQLALLELTLHLPPLS
jgi:hypothetical protein